LLNEVELISIVEKVFSKLGINVVLKLNNRKVLYGIAEVMGHADKMIDITVAIDKLEKIGLDNVKAELAERGIEAEAVAGVFFTPLLHHWGGVEMVLAVMATLLLLGALITATLGKTISQNSATEDDS
jgi:histidyl-tRNA synthetase